MSVVPIDHSLQQAREAEEYVIGAVLLDPSAMDRLEEIIRPESFSLENHREIFAAFMRVHESGHPVDIGLAAEQLRRRGVFENVGGLAHLASLQENCPTAANVEVYARIVADGYVRRQLGILGGELTARHRAMEQDPEDLLRSAEEELFALAEHGSEPDAARAVDLTPLVVKEMEARMEGRRSGVSTGFDKVDRVIGGMRPQEVYIVAGRPGMGKSSYAFQIAAQVAESGTPVAIFSLEMSKEQALERILCQQARVDAHRAQNAHLGSGEWDRLYEHAGPVGDLPLIIDGTPSLDEVSLRERCRRLRRSDGIGLVVVDYLQLVIRRGKSEGPVIDTSKVSRALKQIARELNVPVLAASQLSRAPESRPDKRPQLQDLRESGAIEQDAAVAMLLFRDEYYNREKSEKPGVCTVIVAKNRFGPQNVDVDLSFRPEYCVFGPLDTQHQPPEDY